MIETLTESRPFSQLPILVCVNFEFMITLTVIGSFVRLRIKIDTLVYIARVFNSLVQCIFKYSRRYLVVAMAVENKDLSKLKEKFRAWQQVSDKFPYQ